jgi:hypothetical protein
MSSSKKTVYLFTTYGMGQSSDANLKITLAKKFLSLIAGEDPLPAQICFYTDGVKLCVIGSPLLDELNQLSRKGVELILCSTCLDTFSLRNQVAVGIIGGMGDIIAAMTRADSVISL